jgi:hypothetical protein
MQFHTRFTSFDITLDKPQAEWLVNNLDRISVHQKLPLTFAQLKSDYELHLHNFELFWCSKPVLKLRENGLLVV